MERVKLEEKFEQKIDSFFGENDFANQQISVFQNESALENSANSQGEEFLDKFLSAIKLFFLYAPGAMLLHMVGMFIKVFILYGESFPNLFPELIGATFIGTFLTMLGIGKLSDLRYLKVPALILGVSFLLSTIHTIITVIFRIDTEGYFWLISFPMVIIWGYLVKRFLDKE